MKFAYLVMAHHKFHILKQLLIDLDDSRNSIFLHIDKKSKNFDPNITKSVKNARIILIPRMTVFWGHYSQIQCVMTLLATATSHGYHDYYHLLVGVEFPIKSQDYIHSFFETNNGCEFIGYNTSGPFLERISYFYFFRKYDRVPGHLHKRLVNYDRKGVELQKKIGIDRIRNKHSYYKKGYANWSITHEAALYVLNYYRNNKGVYRFTFCADEIIVHTALYHSVFYKKVYNKEDEYLSAMRYTTWKTKNHRLSLADLNTLLASDKLFARKIDDDDALLLINELINHRK